jgi:transmembrane sensor
MVEPAVTQMPAEEDETIWQEALDWTIRLNGTAPNVTENDAFTAWLGRSEAHRAAYQRADRVWALTGAAAPTSALTPGERPRSSARPPARRVRRAAIAATLLAASIMLLLTDRLNILIAADYRTGLAETRTLQLEDGTQLTLNADSAIAVEYDEDRRVVRLLAGEVLVKVGTDRRPFSLVAAELEVADIGTIFDVDLQPQALTVSVQEGSVAANYRNGPNESSMEIGHDERIRIDRATGTAARSGIDGTRIGDWSAGQLVVESVPIADVIAELQRYYRGFILVRDPAFAARTVSGVFDLKDPVRALRAAVRPYAGDVQSYTPLLVTVSGPAQD